MQGTPEVAETPRELPEVKVMDGIKVKDSFLGIKDSFLSRLFPDFSDRKRASIIYALGEAIKTYGADRKVTVSYNRTGYNRTGREIASAYIDSEDRAIHGSINHFQALDAHLGFARAQINLRLTTRIPQEEYSGLARVVTEQGFSLE